MNSDTALPVESLTPAPLALITGGTSGIGRAVAGCLADDHDLALGYADDHRRAETVVEELASAHPGTRVSSFGGRLVDHDSARRLVDQVRAELGAPRVLVHCAGRSHDELFLRSDFDRHVERLGEHLVVAMALAHLLLDEMYRQRCGRVIFLSSIAARQARRGRAGYAAAKAGLEGFTRSLALEVAHRGITVNAVAPGLIATPMTEPRVAALERGGRLRKAIPAGRVGQPEEVGALVRFLCSEDAGYITGTVLTIDGGRSLGDPS